MYKFVPIRKTLVWGTESWVLSGIPGSESVVSEGPDAGRRLADVWPGEFPLLIKFIETRSDLSIQVHPGDALAAARHGGRGKTEMWYVIGAEPGTKLYCGLKEKISPAEYDRLVAEDRIAGVLAGHTVSPGDVFFVPAGRIHAIGGGCFLAEIQQSSDLTYRIYDYKRAGLDGKPRPLHTELARDAIDYETVRPDYRMHYERRRDEAVRLVQCPCFTTDLYDLSQPLEIPVPEPFLVLTGLSGTAAVRTAAGESSLQSGEAMLVLAADGTLALHPGSGGVRLLATRP